MSKGIRGITVEIGGDTTKLGKALEGVNSKTKSLQSELKGVNTLLKMDPSNVTLLKQKQDILTQAIAGTKDKLETLKIAQEQALKQFEKGEISEEQYRDLQREIISTEQKLEKLTDELKEFGSVGAQQIAQVGEKVKDVGGKVTEFGKGFSVVSAGTGAVLAGSIAAFVELDEGYDTIITKTGATGEALDELNTIADDIFGSMPTDMATVGIAVGEVNTRFGYTGEELKKLSTQFIQFSEINGVDLNNSIGTVDKVLEQFNMDASETGDILDLITLKAQQTGIGADTLMNLVQQNGATFKDMGMGVKEAVVLLSQFEANGVDVNVALKSLKKATVEYAKEGVSMEKGLAKTIDTIKNAKTETEALAEVEKLFGAKGANDMVKAIREGRLSIEDLTGAMGEYGDVVSNTFNATLDPIDQSKVAMNNLKLAGSQLGGVLQTTFAPMLTSLVEKLKNLVTWFSNLSPSMKKTIVITLAVTTALGPLIIGLGNLITAFGSIMTVAPKVATAISSLWATISAHPIGALVTVVGAVVAGLVIYQATAKKTQTATQKMCAEMDKFNDSIRENAKAQNEAKIAREKAMLGTEHEFGYYSQLVNELDSITDVNGRVIKGYEERASVITGILSDALGQEITTDQLIANGKQNIIDKINQLILTKKAEIQLSANEGAYTEAIQNSTGALNTYIEAKNNASKIDSELAQAQKELDEATEEYGYLLDLGSNSVQEYMNIITPINTKINELTAQQEENNTALKEAESVYLGYQATIQNYEGLSGAIIEKDAAKINTAITNLVNGFITAENGTKDSLNNQWYNAKVSLANLKQAFDEGAPGVTQAMITEAEELVKRCEAEYKRLAEISKAGGENTGKAVVKGAESTDVGGAGTTIGGNFGKGFVNGMNATLPTVQLAASRLGSTAMSSLRSSIKEGSPSKLTKESGGFFGQGFAIGIKNSIPQVLKSVNSLVTNTKNQLLGKQGFDIHSPSRFMSDKVGKQLIAGLIKGVNSDKNNAKKSAKELFDLYLRELDSSIKTKRDYHEVAIGDEIYLWKQMLAKYKAGSEEYKQVELKIIDAHKRYVAEQSKTNNMSLQDEINYWTNLLKTVDKNSVSYRLIMEQLDEANKSKSDSRLKDLESDIKKKQNYREIEISDEVRLWEEFLKASKKGSDEYKDAEIKLFDAHKKLIDDNRENNDMSLQDEMTYWFNLSATVEDGSVMYKYIMERYGEVRKEYEESFVDNRETYVDNQKNINAMSLGDEVRYWRKLLKTVDKNSDNYNKIFDNLINAKKELAEKSKELDEEYATATKEINTKLIDDIQAVNDEYNNAVKERQKNIVSSMGLFDAFSPSGEIDKYTLADNLESQVDALKEWDSTLDALSNRKGLKNSGLLTELQEMGVDSLHTLQQINSMSDEELQQYINLYDEKNKIALERATVENEKLRVESQRQISVLISEANNQLNTLEIEYNRNLSELGVTLIDQSKQIGSNIVQGLMGGMVAETPTFQTYLSNFFNGIVEQAKNALDIHSPSRVFENIVGKQIPAGIAKGISENSDVAKKAINDMTSGLVDETSFLNGATINRKLNTTFSATFGNGRTLTDIMDTMIECSNKIYDRLNRLQIVLDSGALVGETIDKIDAGLANRQLLTARGL